MYQEESEQGGSRAPRGTSSTVDDDVPDFLSRLRKKVDEGFARPLLHTVRGAGYRLGVAA
mgnify:CR=1 FL=1